MSANQDELQERHEQTLEKLDQIRDAVTPPKIEPTVITRSEWKRLSPQESSAFFKRGGTVRDPTPEEIGKAVAERRKTALEAGAMLRTDWDRLSQEGRANYIRGGGKVVD